MKRSLFVTRVGWLAALTTSLWVAGCSEDHAYCFNCSGNGNGNEDGSAGAENAGNTTGGQPALADSGVDDEEQCEADLENDPLNCGSCGWACDSPFGMIAECNQGICSYECASGYFDVDPEEDGCEYECTETNGGVEQCDEIDNDCDGLVDEDLSKSTLEHCGACNVPCYIPGAHFSCDEGACEITSCLDGFQDVDEDPTNGCEYRCSQTAGGMEVCDGLDNDCNGLIDDDVDTSSDPQNCGACGSSCAGTFPNAQAACEQGQCVLGECDPQFSDADGDPDNGCEYSCEATCFFPFATYECNESGRCAMGECLSGYWDIDGDSDNGCEYPCSPTQDGVEVCDGIDNDCNGFIDDEVDTSSDPLNCGSCGRSCVGEFAHAEATCELGQCVFGACVPGYYDENGDPEDGCEYNCQSTCKYANALPLCGPNGTCSMGNCFVGYWDLDGDADNGCEYPCAPTNDGTEICDGLDNDCDGSIDNDVDTSSDPLNCGACGESCVGEFDNAEPTCEQSECVFGPCLVGYFDIDGDPDNGCEHSCQATCAFPFAVGVCSAEGECSMGACLLGYFDIDEDPSNGCEYECTESNLGEEACDGLDNDCDGEVDEDFDFEVDNLHCGGCNTNCELLFPGATTECQDSACVPTGCLSTHVNLDGNLLNGCEYLCEPTQGGVEQCDGVDNDCDGLTDETPAGGFNPPLPEQCPSAGPLITCEWQTLCVDGSPTCVEVTGPTREICDGLDNDCDGSVDENPVDDPLPQVGKACGQSQVGECEFGTTVCQGSSGIVCQGAVGPEDSETCNGLDDDCNGVVDDDPDGQGDACRLDGGLGACANGGTQQCMGASGFVCSGATAATDEVCDGPLGTTDTRYDNDCDGTVNEGCLVPGASAVRLDTNGSNQTEDSSFQLAATSRGNTFFVVYSDRRNGASDVYGRVSTDAGQSWGTNDILTTPSVSSAQLEPSPMLSAQRAYIAYSRFHTNIRRIYTRRSSSPYDTWSNPVKVDDRATDDDTVDCYAPRGVVAQSGASAAQDRLAVVWSEIAGTAIDPTRNIYLSYSTDGAGSWSTPLLVNAGAGQDKAELPVVATDGAGMVYIAWRDKRVADLAQAYTARVDLTAATPAIQNTTRLQPNVAGASAEQIAIAAAGQNVYVAWTDLRASAKAIRLAYSRNRGQSYSQVSGVTDGIVVNQDSTFADATDPALAARSNRIVVVWADTRSGKADIRLNHSEDAAATWLASSPRVDTGDTLGQTTSVLPRVALGAGNSVLVTWQDLRFPRSAVIANVSIDRGTTFYADAGGAYRMDTDNGVVPGADSQTPLVLASDQANRGSVVWVDFLASDGSNSQNGDIYARSLE